MTMRWTDQPEAWDSADAPPPHPLRDHHPAAAEVARRLGAHNWGGSDHHVYRLLLARPGLTDREGAELLGLSSTTYRIQRWRLWCSRLVVPVDPEARPRRWVALRGPREPGS